MGESGFDTAIAMRSAPPEAGRGYVSRDLRMDAQIDVILLRGGMRIARQVIAERQRRSALRRSSRLRSRFAR